ncbi:kinase-like domain-containing protein [Myxozyma melibiosi]|uniref:Kinase-like domain-containing protein n=1 Tax=Myxozyma melibiosi TaxID=54550 RepID=A0ABR1F7Q6_9ASCO
MSVIRYNQNQSVVLQDPVRGAVVVYDADSRQLKLHRDLSLNSSLDAATPTHDLSDHHHHHGPCPYCGRGATPPLAEQPGSVPVNNQNRRFFGQQPLPSSPDRYSRSGLNGAGLRGRTFVDANYFRLLQDASTDRASREPSEPLDSHTSPSPSSDRIGISSSAYSEGYFERFFVTERELGRGGRGAVYLVEHVLDGVSLGRFACKKIPVGDDHKWLERVLREVDLLRITHANLVNYNHVWLENAQLTSFGPKVPCIFILQEYCDGGTLEEYVNNRSGIKRNDLDVEELKKRARMRSKHKREPPAQPRSFLSLEEIGSFFIDITSGLNHLHQNGFVHRDLKPSNCLLDLDSTFPKVLVSDFGEGQREGAKRDATGATGTVGFCAPETLIPDAHSGELPQFSFKTDMFSLGMILYFLCFSQLPYQHEFESDFDALRSEVIQWNGFDRSKVLHLRSDLPTEIYDLLSQLLSPDPDQRPTAESLLDLIGVNIERGRKRSSGSVGQSSISSAPTSATRSSSVTDSISGLFSLWRSQVSHEPPESSNMSLMPHTSHLSYDNDDPGGSDYEDISPSTSTTALERHRSASIGSSELAVVKTESGALSESALQYPSPVVTRAWHARYLSWLMSYVVVGLVASFITYYAMKRQAIGEHPADIIFY